MRHASAIVTLLAVLVGIVAIAAPAFAEYGAIAYDDKTCAWGRAWNFPDQAGADARALSECASSSSNCKVIARMGVGECGAVAAMEVCSGYGWATRPSISEAQLIALQQCLKANPNQDCRVTTSICSSR